ncbi:hypothetical protein HYC85_003961 [Camellia sinensis]|uniref:Uncharacterized protein n=1 Tax=Camellia sinensis TaxID=4442 RepID=A0A7J7HX92_CAMSI|nr:hypothetical protein HYC85_003961 [Camellia sinensis]
MEFATGGLGFSLQWWDQRKPGGPTSQFKGGHKIIVGGSSGTVFAWDLRWQQQPIVLSGVAVGEFQSHSLSESEIWEVQYDSYSSNIGNMSTSRVLPVMICSEDGILAVVEQDSYYIHPKLKLTNTNIEKIGWNRRYGGQNSGTASAEQRLGDDSLLFGH